MRAMKKLSVVAKSRRRARILASCEETRQQCNKLTDEERRKLRDEAFRIIHGADAKTPTRSR